MTRIVQDLRYAVRGLSKSPAFTTVAVLTLALGIGANATIFSFADALLLRPLPVPDADRIVHVYQRRPGSGDSFPMSYADYLDYRAQTRSFDALAAHYDTSPMHLVVDGDPQAVDGAVVTATYFDLLRLQPALGRFFLPEEDLVPDRDAVAVISHALWRRTFDGSPSAVGQTLRLNGQAFTVIGVAPRGFSGVHNGGIATHLWIPAAMLRVGYRFCDGFDRSCTIVDMLGKLRPGVTVAQAQEELDVIAARLAAAYPQTNRELGVTVVAARGRGYGVEQNRAEAQQLRLFLVAVGLVLLIGCANVAGLLLARAVERRKEIAVRLALGATRYQLVRQLFTESAVIATLGAGAGLLIAFWAKDFIGGLDATDYAGSPRDFQTDLSGTVVIATATVTLLATVLFGLVPALQASKLELVPVLKDEGASGGSASARLRKILVVGQIALTVALLVGTGLLIRSVDKVLAGPGFDPRPVITVRLRPGLLNYPTEKALAFQREVIARLAMLPGVIGASPADGVATPLASTEDQRARTPAEGGRPEQAYAIRQTRVGPQYFATLGVPMIEGREFDGRDTASGPKVVVINDVLARRISPDAHLSGRTLMVASQPHEIIGVVKDAQYYTTGQAPQAAVYRAYWQPNADGGFNKDSRTIVRIAGDAATMMETIRRTIASVDAAVPISEDYPLSQRIKYEFQPVQRARTLLAAFAILAVVLTAVGLYGVLAFAVAQRTREIGLRMALGAERRDVARLMLRDGFGLTIAGAALGLLVAWMSARFIASLLYGVDVNDAAAYLTAPAILLVVALLACYLPVRRAARVDPLVALRYE